MRFRLDCCADRTCVPMTLKAAVILALNLDDRVRNGERIDGSSETRVRRPMSSARFRHGMPSLRYQSALRHTSIGGRFRHLSRIPSRIQDSDPALRVAASEKESGKAAAILASEREFSALWSIEKLSRRASFESLRERWRLHKDHHGRNRTPAGYGAMGSL